jgi:hypothetical protein
VLSLQVAGQVSFLWTIYIKLPDYMNSFQETCETNEASGFDEQEACQIRTGGQQMGYCKHPVIN